jgi:CheY-like chemotaxis protein
MAISSNQALHILVVDDEPMVSTSIQMLLKSDGHTVTIASDGKKALWLLDQGKFNLVITDYTMPGMNGDELSMVIKKNFPSLPVIMVTAYAESLPISGNLLKGVDLLMNKPFSWKELRMAVAQALAEK